MTSLNFFKAIVIPNPFRDYKLQPPVILKQVQDDEVLNKNGSRGDAEARRVIYSLRTLRTLREPQIIARSDRRDTQSLRTDFLRASASLRESLNPSVRARGAA
jgi:hypothetical protein